MHSHDSIYWAAVTVSKALKMKDCKEVMVSYMPLSHIAANMIDMWGMFLTKGTIVFADKSALKGTLVQTLQEARPTSFFGVPRVYEKIVEGIKAKHTEFNRLKKIMFETFTVAGKGYHLTGTQSITYAIGKHIFYSKILAALGLDQCHTYLTGTAPIASETYQYLLGLDIVPRDVYGMSEGVVGTMEYNDPKYGSSGNAIPGSRVKTEGKDDKGNGEICYWGRHVMMGYLKNERQTNEAIDVAGWLHTGDLGFLDDDNYLFVTGV